MHTAWLGVQVGSAQALLTAYVCIPSIHQAWSMAHCLQVLNSFSPFPLITWICGCCARFLALMLAVLSIAIVLAEATISPHLPNLSEFSRALHETSGNELATELLTFVSLVRSNS